MILSNRLSIAKRHWSRGQHAGFLLPSAGNFHLSSTLVRADAASKASRSIGSAPNL